MKTPRTSLSFLLGIAMLVSLATCIQAHNDVPHISPGDPGPDLSTLQPGDSQRPLTFSGVDRTYILHLPPGLTRDRDVPLVFVFHGYSQDASIIEQASGFNEVADKNGFIVVYPNGSGDSSALSWNAGGCCGFAMTNNINESDNVRQIIHDLDSVARVDPKRIYASGFSNGAMLTYRLACEMSEVFAAVAPVSGVLVSSPCQPAQPVSILDFHGLADDVIPYGGGSTLPVTGEPFPPVEQSLATWANLDGCANSPATDQNGLLTHTAYGACQNDAAVELYAVSGLGHSWPPEDVVQATQMIWDFFAAHPKP
jgi:polyhydroxybutyrate depolymerase